MSASSRRQTWKASRVGWLWCLSLVAACGATHLVDHEAASDNGVVAVAAGSGGAAAPPIGGVNASDRGGSPELGGVPGGAALGGANDVPTSGGEASALAGAAGAASPDAAGAPPIAECPRGTPIAQNTPADCHATACDGHGGVLVVIDLKNHPVSADPCNVDSCDAQGKVVTQPSPAGTACNSAASGKLCDGAGQCVQCLTTADCGGNACLQGQCVSASCNNGVLDGAETDVDCGGVCSTCAETQTCKLDQDCASDNCEQLRLTCLPTSCLDGIKDGSETDVDCGGADCSPCYLFEACLVDADCATNQCDAAKLTCRGSACRDKRIDGTETDVDCGGWDCGPCHVGQKCLSNFDCQGGHLCSTQLPHVCYGF